MKDTISRRLLTQKYGINRLYTFIENAFYFISMPTSIAN